MILLTDFVGLSLMVEKPEGGNLYLLSLYV